MPSARRPERVTLSRIAAGLALVTAFTTALGACAPSPPSAPPSPTPAAQAGWQEHEIPTSMVALSLPPDWLAFGEDRLGDPDVRADLERQFAGARGLFSAIEAQGSRVRVVFVGVDPAARGRPELTPTVAVVAVEPRIPTIGLGLAADLVLDALDAALDIETDVERATEPDPPVGDAIRFAFEHRVADGDGGPGLRAALTDALVTTDASSFLIVHNAYAADAPPGGPTLDDVLTTIRVLP